MELVYLIYWDLAMGLWVFSDVDAPEFEWY
jgi:hypothetical protein